MNLLYAVVSFKTNSNNPPPFLLFMNVMNAVFAKVIVSYCGGSCRLVVLLAQTSAEKLRQRCRDEMFAYETDDIPKSYKPPGSLA